MSCSWPMGFSGPVTKPKQPALECGKIAPNGYPCFLPEGHATPAPVDYPTSRYDASPEEIERYRQARLGCIGRKPTKEKSRQTRRSRSPATTSCW